jgi:hypothetical protein
MFEGKVRSLGFTEVTHLLVIGSMENMVEKRLEA